MLRVLQHVSSLHQYFPGRVTELAPRQSYRLDVFIARAAMNLTFMINFSPTFPVVPPSIAVQPALSHAWVDGNMNVYGHPSLLSWNGAVLVGKIIKDVELEFSLRPPMVLPQAPRTAPQAPAAREEAVSFPEVDLKTQNELMEMLEDESKFIAFFETTKAFKKAKKVLSELESQNIELARTVCVYRSMLNVLGGNMALLQEAQDLSGNLSSSLAVLEEQEEKSKRIFTQNKSLLDVHPFLLNINLTT